MTGTEASPIRLDRQGGIARITFDVPGERPNTLGRAVMHRLTEVLEELESRTDVRGALILSGKDGMFIAGADVSEFQSIEGVEHAVEAIRAGQAIMDRVEALPFPTVAAIGGVCLGGGTELALACTGRVGSDHPRFQIGLPEVQLGILPAWGGCTRLPRRIGLIRSLDFILKGRGIDAKRALRLGLIDQAVADTQLEARALDRLEAHIEGTPLLRVRRSFRERMLEGSFVGRRVLFAAARKKVVAETKGHYPAPLAVIEVLRDGYASKARSLALECEHASRLLTGDVSRNLVRLFFLNEAAKKTVVGEARSKPRVVRSAAVVGAGTMGGGIARLFAASDVAVRLKDIHPEALAAGLRAAREIFERRLKRKRMTRWELEQKMARIAPTLEFTGFRQLDVIVEAVVEDLEIKKSVLRELEPFVREDAILATNTSTLSISAMQTVLARPERMAGFHFFNPVDRMPLVEVIRGRETNDLTVTSLVALARKLGKTPVVVRDGPGFLVNRILGPYLNEAGFALEETGNIAAIDRAFEAFGMPMGPLRLLDEVGLDVAQKAGKVLAEAFGERAAPSPVVDALVAAGRLGRKNGRGFYRYDGSSKKKPTPDPTVLAILGIDARPANGAEIVERGLSLMVAEATRCLEDETVRTPGELDLAMIMGTGFPPFRGGLLRYADSEGVSKVVDHLAKWRPSLGPRFDVPESLEARRRFY